ncbi:MAG: hypothetical protein AVO35_12930 [Candidatus Aegiribacteria sp. MLS_C]|nr:MAG: hypothetical protein AVO35_12930 [Candidatus Aegiribacteria sp. MLS_C]
MKGCNTYHFRESVSILLRTKWVGPYLLIPPMLAFMVYAEAFLAAHGAGGMAAFGNRMVLAVWNASFLLALVAGIKSCLFFSGCWGSDWFRNSMALPVSRSSGYWGPYLAVLTVSTAVFILTVGAVVAALPGTARFSMTHLIGQAYLPVAWAVSMGAFLGILTTGTGAAVFFSALLLLGFASGLPSISVPEWMLYLIPPLGRLMTRGMEYPQGLYVSIGLAGHAAFFSMLGRILYGAALRRR